MIMLFLALTSLLLVSPAWSVGLEDQEFEQTIEVMCFTKPNEGEPELFYGQEHPLANTLENFIGLLEKLEIVNPNLGIKEELNFFIQNYIYENIDFTSAHTIAAWKPNSAKEEALEKLWKPFKTANDGRDTVSSIPYSRGENCSIFSMISHSIIREDPNTPIYRSATNNSRFYLTENANTLYPREIGVVAIRGTTEAVALGKVLIGMYIGSNSQREKNDITELKKIPEDIQTFLEKRIIDPLFTFTVAEVLSLTKWIPETKKRDNFAGNGEWKSNDPNFDTKDICPIVYKLPATNSSQSYSSLRGAADGLIIGSIMGSILESKSEVKLSEVLRMYYSKGGISAKIDAGMGLVGPEQIWASFCNRNDLLQIFREAIQNQVALYVTLISGAYRYVQNVTKDAMDYYDQEKEKLFQESNAVVGAYCRADFSTDKVENLPLESPLDITAVLDTDHGMDQFRKQQLILGYFIKEMELRYYGSRITVLTDQKLLSPASASSGIVTLTPIVEEAYSSACAACMVAQVALEEQVAAPESEVITAIDQLLQAKKENETNCNGVKGKVIIYFNFKEEETTSIKNGKEDEIERALRSLNLNHGDVAKYAVGRSKELVKKYAKNDISFALDVDNPEQTGKELFAKVSKGAATLQYIDCEKASRENAAIYEDFVSRNSVQHWRMPAKYFYKSKSWKFMFESSFGAIKVCYYQGTSNSPEYQESNCIQGTKVEFSKSNPCKGLNQYSCSPFNFAIVGLNSTEDKNNGVCKDTTMTTKCKTMDQIKFRISHEGIRCSGTAGLLTSPIWMILGVFLLQILQRRQ